MSPEQLDSHFKLITEKRDDRPSSSLYSKMNLKVEDFEKLPSITKKKVLINMTTVRQQIPSDPNAHLGESRMNNLKQLIGFSRENRHFLTQQSKANLSEQFLNLLKATNLSSLKSLLLGNLNIQTDLTNVGLEVLKNDAADLLKQQLSRVYSEENERIYSEATLEQMPEYSRVVKFITDTSIINSTTKTKIKEAFHNGLKKALNKRSLKALSFDDQYALLEALPSKASSVDETLTS